MPELPEVEVFVRYLARHVLGRPIVSVAAGDAFVRRDVSESQLRDALVGGCLACVRRHGKWAFIGLAAGDPACSTAAGSARPWLVVHFGMTGAPVALDNDAPMPRFPRFVIDFGDGGHLVLDDARRLGGVSLAESPEAWIAVKRLGPDALDASPAELAAAIRPHRGRLKPLLMDQTIVAGVGNVYADEILYQARLHPLRRVDELDDCEVEFLAETIHRVLAIAVDLGALFHLMPSEWLVRNRHEGGPCPDCAGEIERIVVGGRSTYLCPSCQPLTGETG
jgi:formamidopyrimidine-DNA glycosylase